MNLIIKTSRTLYNFSRFHKLDYYRNHYTEEEFVSLISFSTGESRTEVLYKKGPKDHKLPSASQVFAAISDKIMFNCQNFIDIEDCIKEAKEQRHEK